MLTRSATDQSTTYYLDEHLGSEYTDEQLDEKLDEEQQLDEKRGQKLGENLARSLGVAQIIHKELSHAVVGAAIEVHRRIGPGMLERAYQRALECELRSCNGVAAAPRF